MIDGGERSFARVLGRWEVLAIAFGAMIGFGWIVRTGDFITRAGTLGATAAFLLGGVVVGLVGLTYAELVSAMPHAGGEHNYVLRALGTRPAFITSWMLVLGYVSVVAFEAVALPQSLSYVFPELPAGQLWSVAGEDVFATWTGVGVLGAAVMTIVNYIGVRPAAVFQSLAVLFLLAVGATLLLGSFLGGDPANMRPLVSAAPAGVLSVLVAVPFLFVGFDVIPQSAGEIGLPFRRIGKLLVFATCTATAWYVLIVLTVGSGLPPEALVRSELAAGDGMSALWNSRTMGTLLVLGGIAGILTSWNGFLLGASRLIHAMASSGMLPSWFGKIHPRFDTPSNAVLFVGGLSLIAPLFGEKMLTWLIDAGGFAIVVAYLMVATSFLVLRYREPDMPRPFRVRCGRTVGGLALALSLGLAALFLPGMPSGLDWPPEWIILGGWALLGAVWLFGLPRTTTPRGGHTPTETAHSAYRHDTR
ncbi:APC family permease [Actinopolyspora halophila]|uniref:APC family permease n=1 Tax=Actinopolyspora halophila TaxID=1850 RepID=UPI0003709B5D|nr:APC family permease [Actinopolyspora halophila]